MYIFNRILIGITLALGIQSCGVNIDKAEMTVDYTEAYELSKEILEDTGFNPDELSCTVAKSVVIKVVGIDPCKRLSSNDIMSYSGFGFLTSKFGLRKQIGSFSPFTPKITAVDSYSNICSAIEKVKNSTIRQFIGIQGHEIGPILLFNHVIPQMVRKNANRSSCRLVAPETVSIKGKDLNNIGGAKKRRNFIIKSLRP